MNIRVIYNYWGIQFLIHTRSGLHQYALEVASTEKGSQITNPDYAADVFRMMAETIKEESDSAMG